MPIEPHVLHTHREAIAHLKRVDPRLARAIDRIVEIIGPFDMKMAGHPGPYEALLRSIFYQQLNGKAAASILGRFKDRFGAAIAPPPQRSSRPQRANFARWAVAPKNRRVRDLSQKALDGTVPSQAEIELLSNEEIIERLTVVRGIGVWTVEMLLIFHLRTPQTSCRSRILECEKVFSWRSEKEGCRLRKSWPRTASAGTRIAP